MNMIVSEADFNEKIFYSGTIMLKSCQTYTTSKHISII